MDDPSLDRLSPSRVARLLDMNDNAGWSETDAAAALAHQLETPLLPDLFAAPGADAARLATATLGGRSAGECTFAQALGSPHTPEDLLLAIKAWAKAQREQAGHPLAGGPATVLYYAAIARARCAGVSISTLSRAQLCEGYAWSRRQAGAERLIPLFDEALGQCSGEDLNDGARVYR